MRLIDIADDFVVGVELWPGRRLWTGNLLVSLPKGAMTAVYGSLKGTVSFGSASRSTVSITASSDTIRALVRAVLDMERPSEGVRTIQ